MSEPARPDPVRTFFGVALVSVGLLMTCLCGLCTGVFLIGGLMPQGDASFALCRDPQQLLRLSRLGVGSAGLLLGVVEEERNGEKPRSEWWRLVPA